MVAKLHLGWYTTVLPRDFFAWAQEDERVTGLAPWHWDSRGVDEVSAYKEIGVVDMPLLKAEWRTIGRAIRGNRN
eukprot:m.343817 g.343817  ORF g.343817 m.343817 type:complete len:75 (-) comp20635_c0_seq1:454-678(-)